MDLEKKNIPEIEKTACDTPFKGDREDEATGGCISDDSSEVNKKFNIPKWVVVFLFFLAGTVVFGFYYFKRFYVCIKDYKTATAFFKKNDFINAEKYITHASDLVPDNSDIEYYKYYISGFKLYSDNKYNDALPFFKKYQKYNKDDKVVNSIILYIEISNAFDQHDYKKMVDVSAELYKSNETDPFCILQYASALACIYTESDSATDFDKAEKLIREAQSYGQNKEIIEYVERIEYRLKTRKIISTEEYLKLKKDGAL